MAQFPRIEPQVKALAQNIVAGLMSNPALCPTPPVIDAALQIVLDSFITLNNQERGKDREYCAISVNIAGGCVPSNTVAAVV